MLTSAICMVLLAACQDNLGTFDDSYAVGEYDLQTVNGKALPAESDVRFALVESGSTTLNADHTFTQHESIRIAEGLTAHWSSSGTWTLQGDKLVKVHNTAAGPVIELAVLFEGTIEAGYSVLVRKQAN
jgi:hypothetical protein